MKLELKDYLISISGWIFLFSVCFFLIVFSVFINDKIEQPFKEALTLTLSFLSAIATFGAAIIAARIFQTWKIQHSYIEQTKLLVEMVETINNLLFAIGDARQNENLKNILLGYRSNLPMNEAFTEQIKRAELLDNFVGKLNTLENQIYLLNNGKVLGRIFYKADLGEAAFDKLIVLISTIKADISYIYETLSINNGNGSFVIDNLVLSEALIQETILNSLFDGDKLLRKVMPEVFLLDHNPVNIKISECIHELNQSILKYKDSLETVN
ncbi:hypothetical protein OHW45_04560 [Acinetobacter baumannii]|uniref:hypothetical protein n=1 Tax=Acinetobacter calcoaceticus/baumannii complex TaxID=909768 RepID=UPI00190117F2|nr:MULTISPECIES: hypothetical protein [Acinetobacter calcoaceticus/baumannii complex]MBJ8506731.1 hypothetical protein [Acinetobacter seifertii]MDC5157253.1 hypothetical protein [Acinetobacter baumannii]